MFSNNGHTWPNGVYIHKHKQTLNVNSILITNRNYIIEFTLQKIQDPIQGIKNNGY